MNEEESATVPSECPVCHHDLLVTNLQCAACGAEVTGRFGLGNLARLREPHASLLDMFLRARGNVKDLERELGLSYPTVRARLEEAFSAAGYVRDGDENPLDRRSEADTSQDELAQRIERLVEARLSAIGVVPPAQAQETRLADARRDIVDRLERGEISAREATAQLRELQTRRSR